MQTLRINSRLIIAGLVMLVLTGCAARRAALPSNAISVASAKPSTQPAFTGDAAMSLDEIPPKPDLSERLANSASETQPSTQPSLEAIELFARARGALFERNRTAAIDYLQRAIKLDPASFALRFDLGRAYGLRAASSDQAIAALADAEKINPDNAELQLQLGRLYLAKDDLSNALIHLRLAAQTKDYSIDDDTAASVDFQLARALQQKGYDRAALDVYSRLIKRLATGSLAVRQNPESALLASRPDSLYLDVAQLLEKHGQYEQSLVAYKFVAEKNPENFDVQSRLVNALLAAGKNDEAIAAAQQTVEKFRASNESLALLRDVYKKLDRERDMVQELRRLYDQRPWDRAVLFALADTLASQNRIGDAADLLNQSLTERPDSPASIDTIKKLFALYESRDDTRSAARVLITYLSERPEATSELSPLWESILRIGRRNPLRLAALQKLDVPPAAGACKLFWVSRIASMWSRDALSKSALEQAVKLTAIYPPAHRAQMNAIWARAEFDDQKKTQLSQELIESAQRNGNAAFAQELRGVLLFNQKKPDEATKALGEAIRLGDLAPDVRLIYAETLRNQSDAAKYEQLVWKLISDRPGYDPAYTSLLQYYLSRGNAAQARKVLTTWLSNDPSNVNAKLLHATLLYKATGRPDTAEAVLLDLFKDNPDNPEVLANLREFYSAADQLAKLVQLLEDERTKHADNRVAVEQLVDIYIAQKRMTDASRVLDAARSAVGNDPDLLYYFAHLYERVEQKQTCERMLEQVLQIDPRHAAANNDLGYMWSDEGRELDRAERMIRIALAEEPDNESFLDSLGWVLYKRGKFGEARDYFEQAVAPASFPDPVVLDHLGDALYRLNQTADAEKQWRRASDRLKALSDAGATGNRAELATLKLTLVQKLKQVENKQQVTVAPIVETRAGAQQ